MGAICRDFCTFLLLPVSPPCFGKAPCTQPTSTLGPSATPPRDLSFPRLQGGYGSVIQQERGLSPQGRKIFLSKPAAMS